MPWCQENQPARHHLFLPVSTNTRLSSARYWMHGSQKSTPLPKSLHHLVGKLEDLKKSAFGIVMDRQKIQEACFPTDDFSILTQTHPFSLNQEQYLLEKPAEKLRQVQKILDHRETSVNFSTREG